MDLKDTDSSESTISTILEYKEQGYLFHGSPQGDISVLEPRESRDANSDNTFNNDCAVFASKLPDACIFALLSKEHIPGNLQNGQRISIKGYKDEHLRAEIPAAWKPYMENNTGTLYILPPETFTLSTPGWQVKSKEAVTPIDKIDVGFDTFQKLGGELIWI